MHETPSSPSPDHDPAVPSPGTQPGSGPSGAAPQSGPHPPHHPPQFAPPTPPAPGAGPYPAYPAPQPHQEGSYPPPGPYGTAPGVPPAAWPPAPDGSTWAMIAHLVGIVFACVGWLPALLVYLAVKNRSPWTRHHAAEALNFQLTLFIPYVVGAGLFVGFGFFTPDLPGSGGLFFVAVWLDCLVLGLMAALPRPGDAWSGSPFPLLLFKCRNLLS